MSKERVEAIQEELKNNREKEFTITNKMWEDSLECKDKKGRTLSKENIKIEVQALAQQLVNTYPPTNFKEIPVLVPVMDGVMPFFTLLYKALKKLNYPRQIATMQTTSRSGLDIGIVQISAKPKVLVGGWNVIVIDEVSDTGETYRKLRDSLYDLGASKVELMVLVDKKQERAEGCDPTYTGFEVSKKDFLLGMGLDYEGYLRDTSEIRTACIEKLPSDEEKAIFATTKQLNKELEGLKKSEGAARNGFFANSQKEASNTGEYSAQQTNTL